MDYGTSKELLVKYVAQLDEEKVIEVSNQLLIDGLEPLVLLDLVNQGMNRVGKLYETREYYIADLIMAGLIFKQVLELDKMTAHFNCQSYNKIGKVVLGTVKGDIHDIGKDIFRGMLEANGFEVIDLGVDVPKEMFLKSAEENKPDIIGLSGVLTNTVEAMKDVVDVFKQAGLRDKVMIIVGGNHLNQELNQYIGADSFANDASTGIRICKEWMDTVEQGVEKDD